MALFNIPDKSYPWLENLPQDWIIKPLHSISKIEQGKAHEAYIDEDGEFICVNSKFISSEGISIKRCNKKITSVNTFDILIVMSDLPNGKALAKAFYVVNDVEKYAVNQRVCKVSILNGDPKFIFYQMSRNPYFIRMDDGINQTHLPNSVFKNFPVVFPSTDKQKSISQFIDSETKRIDNLISEKKAFIKLLKEKRQSLITHFVTKGLDPNAPMKDSGVEWIGEVPEHWKVGDLRYYASLNTGATPSRDIKEYWNGNIPWISTSEVKYKDIHFSNEYITETALNNCSVKLAEPETLLMAMYGQGVTRGRVAILKVYASYNQACVAIKVSSNVYVKYLYNFYISAYKELRQVGNLTSQMNLNSDLVGRFKILIPPMNEQLKIVKEINNKVHLIDDLVNDTLSSISLLKERRSALITAAVTGKIVVTEANNKEEGI